MNDPYIIPDDGKKRTINFSGGRSSGYMLRKILDANTDLTNTKVVFCNTGKEREETLEFVHEVEQRWNVPIVWLEYHYDSDRGGGISDPRTRHKVVDYTTAARNGEPFAELIKYSQILPNVVMRKCTQQLKVETTNRYLRRDLKWNPKTTMRILGIRYDERRRWAKAIMEQCDVEYPMVHAMATKHDVDAYWKQSDFDLGIDSTLSNCDLCFLKGANWLTRTIAKEPALADWWIDQEEEAIAKYSHRLRNSRKVQFFENWTFRELRDNAVKQLQIPYPEETPVDCFCDIGG